MDAVLAMSPPLPLGLVAGRRGRRPPLPDGLQRPGRVPGRRHRAREADRPPPRPGRPLAGAHDLRPRRSGHRALRGPRGPTSRPRSAPSTGATSASSPTSSTPTLIRPLPRDTAYRRELGITRRADGRAVRRQRRLLPVARPAGRRGSAAAGSAGAGVRRQRWRLGAGAPQGGDGRPRQRPLRPLPAQGAPGRGPGQRRPPRRAAPGRPGRLERAVEDLLDPGRRPPAAGLGRPEHGGGPGRGRGPGRPGRPAGRRRRLHRRRGGPRSRPDDLVAMGERGRAWVERWISPEAVAEAYERLFTEVGRAPGRPAVRGPPPASLSSSWAKHRRPRRRLGSPRARVAARCAPSRVWSSRSRSSSSSRWAWPC